MRHAIIRDGQVQNIIVLDPESGWTPPDGTTVAVIGDRAASIGDLYDGEAFAPPTQTPTEADYAAAIQAHLDGAARSRGYDSALSIATYVGSSIPHWAAEATAFFAWRDQVWAYAYAELAKVQGGQREQPSVAELIEELPVIAWPEV